ncbi:MAG: HD domain-containing protein [Bacteroidales bacterium]|nr:HD domain-containing protein [Bacteroidales bacterium]
MNPELEAYIEAEIIPRYRGFDKAHREDHVRNVIAQALDLARYYDVDSDLVYAAAAYHDTGLAVDRATHHLESGRIIRADRRLLRWFTPLQVETVAQAAEDHRASSKTAPRSIYGRLIAEADRFIEPMTIVRRTIQFGLDHYPELDTEGHWERTWEHLREKYGDGGYLQLWIPESPNAARLEELRKLIRNPESLRSVFDKLFAEERPTA